MQLWSLKFVLFAAVVFPACQRETVEFKSAEAPFDSVPIEHTGRVFRFEVSSNDRWILTLSEDGRVIQWDVATGEMLRSFAAKNFEFTADGRSVLLTVSQGEQNIPTRVSLATGRVLDRVEIAPSDFSVYNATYTTDEKYILISAAGALWNNDAPSLALWDVEGKSLVWTPKMPLPYEPSSDEWTPPGDESQQRYLGGIRGDRKTVQFYRHVRPDGKMLIPRRPLDDHWVARDGQRMLTRRWEDTGSSTDVSTFWDVESLEPLQNFAEPINDDFPLKFDEDKNWFIHGVGQRLATRCDALSGETLLSYEGHQDRISDLALSPDCQVLATASREQGVILWDVESGEILHQMEYFDQYQKRVASVNFSSDSSTLSVGTNGSGVWLFDVKSGKAVKKLENNGRTYGEQESRFAHGDEHLIELILHGKQENANAYLWDVQKNERKRRFTLPSLYPMEISPDGRWAIAWRLDGEQQSNHLSLWDLKTGQEVHRFERHLSKFELQFSDYSPDELTTPAGNKIFGWVDYSFGRGRTMKVGLPFDSLEKLQSLEGFDAKSQRWIQQFVQEKAADWLRETRGGFRQVASLDGKYGATCKSVITKWPYFDHAIQISEIESGEILKEWKLITGRLSSAAFSPDSSTFVVTAVNSSNVATATMWDVETGEKRWEIDDLFEKKFHSSETTTFSKDGKYIAFYEQSPKRTVIFDAELGEHILSVKEQADFLADGKYLFADGVVWELAGMKKVCQFKDTTHLILSPNGRFIYHEYNGDGAIFSVATGEKVQDLNFPIPGHIRNSDRLRFNVPQGLGRAGNRIVTRRSNPQIDVVIQPAVWNLDTGEKICELVLEDGVAAQNATFSPDGRKILSTLLRSEDKSFYFGTAGLAVWDSETGALLSTGEVDTSWTTTRANKLKFLNDGEQFVTNHGDAVVLWDLDAANPLRHFSMDGHTISEFVLSPDENRLLTVSDGYGATVWDIETGELIQEFSLDRVAEDELSTIIWNRDVRFTEAGLNLIVVTHQGRGVHVLNIESGEMLRSFYLLGDGERSMVR